MVWPDTGCPFAQHMEPWIPKWEKNLDSFVVAELAYARYISYTLYLDLIIYPLGPS